MPLQPSEWWLFEEQAEGEEEEVGEEGKSGAGERRRRGNRSVIGRAEEVIGRVREGVSQGRAARGY